MSRRIVWLSLLVIGVLVLAGTWFISNYERVPYKERTGEEAEARRNPHLALERFFARMGRPLARQSNARSLDTLVPGGVLILDRNRRHHMSPERTERLMAWVEAGGYLIVVPEYIGVSDPVCAKLGVGQFKHGKNPLLNDEDEDEEEADPQTDPEANAPPPAVKPSAKPSAKRPPRPETLRMNIPGAGRPLVVNFWTAGRQAGKRQPEWHAGDANYGDQFLHYQFGRGQVTVADGLLGMLNNHAIGKHDHAELIWTLVQTYQPDPAQPITLMSKLAVPSLWDWLAESAWTAVIAGLALLALWIWRILPRFGPVVPEPEASRRELREHLTALGRYVWRAGGLEHWLDVAREDFLAKLALRHPAVAAMPPEAQAEELARMSRRSAALIGSALFGPAGSPHSFTLALRTLRNLDRSL